MTITLSSIARTQLDQAFKAMDGILAKAADHAREHGVEESVYLNWRLAPDMFPLVRQVQLISDFSMRGLSRLAGVDPVSMADDETDFASLRERLDRARSVIESLDTAAIDASPDSDITFPAGRDREMTLPRQAYLQNFIITNVLFHASASYAILRHIGVPIGKADMMGISR
ncbi:DUF1993 domain-containing protein [Maricaulis sp. CAU 1757]